MSDGFKTTTLRDEIQPRGSDLTTWQKVLLAQQMKDVERCPQNEDSICSWSIKYSKQGAFWCHGRYYRDCSVWMRVQANDGDPSVLIQ